MPGEPRQYWFLPPFRQSPHFVLACGQERLKWLLLIEPHRCLRQSNMPRGRRSTLDRWGQGVDRDHSLYKKLATPTPGKCEIAY